jgi:hypothetical protein
MRLAFTPDANLLNCHLIVAAAESLCQRNGLRTSCGWAAQDLLRRKTCSAQDLLRRKTCSGARPAQMFHLLLKAPSRELKVGKVEA